MINGQSQETFVTSSGVIFCDLKYLHLYYTSFLNGLLNGYLRIKCFCV